MKLNELLFTLQRRDIKLQLAGSELQVDAPVGALTDDLRVAIREHKPAIIRALQSEEDPLRFGEVCKGWTRQSWIVELRRKADRCDRYRPDMASYFRAWADSLDVAYSHQPSQESPCPRPD